MARSIAIVEDEPAIRANYTDALKRHGLEIWAYSGRQEASSERSISALRRVS